MKLLVIGHGRHGKDTVCEMIRDIHGLNFVSSSYFALERVIWPALRDISNYGNPDECYADRHNHRALWFELIKFYNKDDPADMARELLEDQDVYCGMRSRVEFNEARKLVDAVIWVDASDRLPLESGGSMELDEEDADYIVDNNSSEDSLESEVAKVVSEIKRDLKA